MQNILTALLAIDLQISTNALQEAYLIVILLTIAISMLTAPTPKARFIALVLRDTLEMALSVKVRACTVRHK